MTGIKLDSVIFGDAYEIVKQVNNRSVDLIIVDPPYQITKGTSSKKGRISKAMKNLNEELEASELGVGVNLSILDDFIRIMKRDTIGL